ncbi:DUF4083 family protein [Gottfriedia sp. NPDC056225]|uniref:DUF4083 family protein n=1 Tax=Gottfriedia sp. NPDC056225 TaxID=3345751 RepID=UPI0035D95BBA
MNYLSGNVSHTITDTKDINDSIATYIPIIYWIIIIGSIVALVLFFLRRNRNQSHNRQSLQNIESKLDKLIELLEKNSN